MIGMCLSLKIVRNFCRAVKVSSNNQTVPRGDQVSGAITVDAFIGKICEALLDYGSDYVVIVTDWFSVVLSPFVLSSETTEILVFECVLPNTNVSHHCCVDLSRCLFIITIIHISRKMHAWLRVCK